FRHSDTIVQPRHRREIAYEHNEIVPIQGVTDKGNHAPLPVAKIDPFEPTIVVVYLIERRLAAVERIDLSHKYLKLAVAGEIQQSPWQRFVVIPLPRLAELHSHKHQFLAGMAEHISPKRARISEASPFVAGHLGNQMTLPMNDLVVR